MDRSTVFVLELTHFIVPSQEFPSFTANLLIKGIIMSEKKMKEIRQLLDKSVRNHMLDGGGNVRLLYLEDKLLHLEFLGACRKCPHSEKSTLKAIEAVVHRYDKQLELVNDTPISR